MKQIQGLLKEIDTSPHTTGNAWESVFSRRADAEIWTWRVLLGFLVIENTGLQLLSITGATQLKVQIPRPILGLCLFCGLGEDGKPVWRISCIRRRKNGCCCRMVPQRHPCPDYWELWTCYVTWQWRIKIVNNIKILLNLNKEINLDYQGRPIESQGTFQYRTRWKNVQVSTDKIEGDLESKNIASSSGWKM